MPNRHDMMLYARRCSESIRWFAPLALIALLASPGRSDEPMVVRVGVQPTITETVLYIGQQRGFFKAEGFDVRFVPFDSSANMIVPLSTGGLEVGGGAPAAGLYNAVGRGLEVRAVADLGSDAPGYGFQQLLVRPDLIKSGRYKTLKDLKGMNMAVVNPGVSVAPMLDQLLIKAGLTYNDVRRIQMPNPDKIPALKNGSIDATLLPEPNASIAIKAGVAVKVMSDDEFYPDQQIGVLLYGTTFLKNHDAGVRFMRAYLRAARLYNDSLQNGKLRGPQTAEIRAILSQETAVTDRSILTTMTLCRTNPDGHMNTASLNADFGFYKDQGLIEGQVRAQDIIDESYVNDALKQLGPYARAKG